MAGKQKKNTESAAKNEQQKQNLFIIGIGASAGGLEALQEFLTNFSKELSNVAIVVAQHLSPTYKSMLVQLLSRATKLKVVEVANMMAIESETVFITPPDSEISLAGGKFILHKPASSTGPKPSVDVFFNSLANEKGSEAIGIILSGTGTDGAKGLKAVKQNGGLTIAQEPETAKYDGMPLAAIQTGYVDLVLSPDKMGEEIFDYLTHGPSFIFENKVNQEDGEDGLAKLLKILSDRTGTDFSNYKSSTICRRLEKRLVAHKLNNINEYLGHIQKHPKELDALFETILIGVTQFFRDKEAFEKLSSYLKELLEADNFERNFRVWVPGCATGEEPYSIAILLTELLGKKISDYHIQIFATDIDDRAIEIARRGVYDKSAVENLSDGLLGKYFNKQGDKYEISKSIKQMVLFSKHDITVHPPFLKLSLISCRNLLIYFGNELQKHIIPIFHYALNSEKYLFLGKSETVGQFSDLFSTVDGKYKIFRRKKGGRLHTIRFSAFRSQQPKKQPVEPIRQPSDYSLSEMVMRTLYNTFEFPYVIVSDTMDIQEIFGDVSPYLSLPQGSMNANIINLVNKDIQIELRSVLTKSIKNRSSVTGNFRKLSSAFDPHYVRIAVKPLIYSSLSDELYIVVFEKYNFDDYFVRKDFIKDDSGSDDPVIKELEQELASTKEHLQTYIEELETANEELQSLNEELQSSNEELQSSNEELETSNEELQSSNEEIQIAYSELRHTNQELEKKENALQQSEMNSQALLNNTLQSFILIDKHYRIVAYNNSAQEFSKLLMEKIIKTGDTLHEFRKLVEVTNFHVEFEKALRGKVVRGENSIKLDEKNLYHFLYNFTPVLDEEGMVNVISLGLINITEHEKTKIALNKSEKLVTSVFESADIGIAVFDQEGKFIRVNKHYCQLLGYKPADLVDRALAFIIPAEDRDAVMKSIVTLRDTTFQEIKLIRKDGKVLDVYESLSFLTHDDGTSYIISTIRDISRSKKYLKLLESAQEAGKLGGWEYDTIAERLNITSEFASILGMSQTDNPTLEDFYNCFQSESKVRLEKANTAALDDGVSFDLELQLVKTNGIAKWVRISSKPVRVYNKTVKIYGYVQEITAHKLQEQTLERLSLVASNTSNPVLILNSERQIEWVNYSFLELYRYNAEDVHGQSCEAIICPAEKNPEEIQNLIKHLYNNNHFSGEILNYRSDGSPIWLHYDISPIYDSSNEIRNFIAIGIDISQRRLFEQQLLEAKERAEELSTLKSNFLANMSHELRTPLVGILGYADLLRSTAEEEKLHKIGNRLYDSGKRMLDTLNLLIDSSNIEANSLKLNKTLFPVKKAVEETLGYYKEKAKSKNLYLRVQYNTDDTSVYQDPRLVRQIINNLVSNAIKFTVNGGVTIEVDSAEKKGVTYVIIKIIDTGIGVDEKDKDFIFEEFRQVSEGKNRSFEGTGLGLSVTKKFVQNCNGIITVDSETGVGSTFTVLLPAEGDNKADNENEVIETDIDANSTISEQLDIDVLLIEDDSSHVELTKAFLEKFCYVDVALSRKEALERANNKKYDLLFIDVNLGDELGGIALAQDIRKMDGYQKTPLVAVSAFALKDDDEMTKGTFNFHLLKPFKSKELRNLINTIIGEDVS